MHRDVKPANVLIRQDGVAKVSDFGISRTTGDQTLTGAGYLTGTPSYFSPALARGAEPGPQDDVWALGATLYAAVEGHPPYERRSNPVEVLHDIVTSSPAAPTRADFLVPALSRMLDRNPDSRWTMEDASHMLRRLADTHRSDATLMQTRESAMVSVADPSPSPAPRRAAAHRPPPAPSPTSGPAAAPRRRRAPGNLRIALIGAVVLLLGAALAWTVAHLVEKPQEGGAARQNTPSRQQPKGPGKRATSVSNPGAKEKFVRDYYSRAPGGTDEAWAMLGPSLQGQGRASYDSFWRRISSVQVESARASEGSDTVEVILIYRTTDGQTSTERKRERLVKGNDGDYLLDTDTPAR